MCANVQVSVKFHHSLLMIFFSSVSASLYWEGHRRSDLVRFGKFAGNAYLWSWKGGVENGAATQSYRNLFSIPAQFVPTLGQNPGYAN